WARSEVKSEETDATAGTPSFLPACERAAKQAWQGMQPMRFWHTGLHCRPWPQSPITMHRPRKTLLHSLGLLGAAAALLSACGGGGGGTDAPATSIQLMVATPTNSGGVFEVQTPVAVQTQV